MRPLTQTDHIEYLNRKPLEFEDSRPRSHRQYLVMRNLQSEFGHTSRMFWIELDCTCTKRSDTYSTCEWGRLRLACAFDTSLASHNNVFCDLFCLPKTLTCEVSPNKALVSLRIIAVNWYIYIVIFGIA